MTINSETRIAGPFEGNDSTVIFPFTFKVFDPDELYVVQDTDGVETVLAWEVDYAVSLNPDQNAAPGGTITMADALATGSTLTLTSDLEALQPLDLANQGGFYPRVINNAFDRVTILIQQLKAVVSRTLKFPLSDGAVGDLPGRAARAGRVLAFDPDTAEPVAGPTIYEVETVAASNEAIGIVASNIDDVITVADNIDDVTNFADVYYGPSATSPATRKDGTPLIEGDMFFNTELDRIMVYNGLAWQETVSGLISVQNFSGDGVTTEFVLGFAPGSEVVTQVFVGGIYQQKNTYEVDGVGGDVLIFSEAPPAGTDNIEVVINSTSSVVLTDAALVVYGGETVESALDSRAETIANVAAIAAFTPVVGRVYSLKEYHNGTGRGGGQLIAKSGVITPDNISTFASATVGIYFERINFEYVDAWSAGAKLDGVNDDAPAFQRAVDYLGLNGGTIHVPHKNIRWATPVVAHAGVILKADTFSDDSLSTNGSSAATPRIFWDGATLPAGIMYLIAPMTNGNLIFGGGSVGITWSGQSKIGYGIRLDTTTDAKIDGRGDQFMVAGVDVCSVGGSLSNFSRRNRIIRWDYIYGAAGNPATANSSGVVLRGNGATFPATQQYLGEITGLVYNGYALYVQETDNAKIDFVSGVRDAGGTGGSLTLRNVGAQPADNNIFEYVTGYVSSDDGLAGNHFKHFNGEASSFVQLAGTSSWHGTILDYVGGKKFNSHSKALRKKINVPVGAMVPDVNAVAARFAGQWDTISLPDVATSSLSITMAPDYDLDSGNIYGLELVVGTNGASAGNYNFTVNFSTVADGGSAATPDYANTFTLAAGLANRVNVLSMPFSPVPIALGDSILLRVIRNGTNPADTNTDSCLILGVRILFVGDGPTAGGSGPYYIPNW